MRLKMKVKFPKKHKITNERKYPRVEAIKKIDYKIIKPQKGGGYTQNLSEEGCCLLLNEELPPGSILELNFNGIGSNSKPVRAIGKVIWQNDYLTGIKFLS